MQAKRQDNKEKISAIMKDREEFRKKDKEIKDRYRAVTALCRQEKPTLEVMFLGKSQFKLCFRKW